ncbi:MAG: FAD-dependent 5-carboxymethylaminomethyl-2-thiouridine(34) oxidoreductase MnmC [Piscinibacter sp.]|uniref:FAD-dependent 5-carboxymethylaminomethyl-2-thiouridine(34) oxidoreductase MnmC n=1 Tax=Piscinibacter sp. TaxID=1903157 RepID=UPI001B6DFAFF|nr:FAD-dependent 5-carboxymethylaminomethyl-2-thiouridine(34) oxidoreductase MnmC [Piscinibacter sp.]MBP5992113.1 FAD-dependent 5-carboxymethylaminomethyl-2-thiouridine(34) oxidoreductase MnmC [Piscinibacter sp.]MBP6029695.1 FAD-dependent 5-carboxymethylaminomethyl-2-thiouridine(34) oxidoreductase MnmC [Piscinibacter sp.]
MKTAPIVAARIERSPEGLPFAAAFGDVYHPRAGALEQARHVFLAGNGLPERWRGRARFVIAETGFGLGNNFLAAWAAWRDDPQRCERLDFLSVELHPPSAADLVAWPRDPAVAELAAQLHAQWPPLTHDLHRLSFEGGRVTLQLAFGAAAAWLPEWVARIDAFFLDGFAPDRNPAMWEARLFKSLARLAAPGATTATWSAARAVRDALHSAGFEVDKAAGSGGKRDISVARFAPEPSTRSARSTPPGRPRVRPVEPRALIVGGGLAGCGAAWALAEQGWHCTVFDRHAEPASEGSGNPGGLFHGIVTPDDGAHARWFRAAAFAFAPLARAALADGVPGAIDGLLRLEYELPDLAAMCERLARLGLPPEYVQALSPEAASARAGLPLRDPAWLFTQGGWISPRGLAAWLLRRCAVPAEWRGGTAVQGLQREGEDWCLLDGSGGVIARAPTVVLANAGDALRLLGASDAADWPVQPVRGQVSTAPAAGLQLPALPLAGAGYVLPPVGDRAVFGATAQRRDLDAAVRLSDHEENLAKLSRLLGSSPLPDASTLQGRVGWRWTALDRLPLIGAVPDAAAAGVGSADQPRLLPRHEGLFMFAALGSRGIAMSVLGARLLAAWVTGAPAPVGASLMDAVDPARFAARSRRKGLSSTRAAPAAE